MSEDVKCWCGRRTRVWVSPADERSITDTGHTSVRICPEHGEWWRDAPSAAPGDAGKA